ncbi:hypothetical protein MKX01_014583 [Papaver californicum]|nr:hypothetical protein MKX01_014583 [Papaver californicum]
MVPSSVPKETTSEDISSSSIFRGSNIDNGFQNERCLSGTVPIRMTKKEELVNAQYLLKKRNPINTNNYTLSPMNQHFISLEEFGERKTYLGGASNISAHALAVDSNQFSTAQIWIQNGPTEQINSIEFGWMAYPTLFGDDRSRIFGYWTVTLIFINGDIHFGTLLKPLSVYGEESYHFPAKVYRDPQTGNRWLSTTQTIGYWPKELFKHLASNASIIRYGGIAGAKSKTPFPSMGNGYLLELQDWLKTGFIANMKYVDEKGQLVDINSIGVQIKHDTSLDCYNILFAGNLGYEWEMTMAFGGPGGMCS